jgi:hypothetical protein
VIDRPAGRSGSKRQVGAQLEIAFEPSQDVQVISPEIQTVSLVQIVLDTLQITLGAGGPAVPRQHNVGFGTFAVVGGAHTGWTIDQDVFAKGGGVKNRDPRYPQSRLAATEPIRSDDPKKGPRKSEVTGSGSADLPSSGFSAKRGAPDNRFSAALLRDQPTVTFDPTTETVAGGMAFEVAALADGSRRQRARWLGSITWGWTMGPHGPFLTPIAAVAPGPISAAFTAAVATWNATPAGGAPMLDLP